MDLKRVVWIRVWEMELTWVACESKQTGQSSHGRLSASASVMYSDMHACVEINEAGFFSPHVDLNSLHGAT